jgi:hypothetical protein
MIQMCKTGLNCTGISVEHLTLNGVDPHGAFATVNGIYNSGAGVASYVDDVNVNNISLTGIFVNGVNGSLLGGTDSGPYTNINYTSGGAACSTSGCPVCMNIQTRTLGVNGITCIGGLAVGGLSTQHSPNAAGIYVQASGNTIRNAHVESFWDGVQIGHPTVAVRDIEVSNLTTAAKGKVNGVAQGEVVNSVHICSATNATGTPGACFCKPSTSCQPIAGAVSDVNLFQLASNSANKLILRDDVTNNSVASGTTFDSRPLGMYLLGNSVPIGAGKAYSLFSTASGSGTIPTWVTGNGPASGSCQVGPGSIYSNTSGVAGQKTIFICSGGTWVGIF